MIRKLSFAVLPLAATVVALFSVFGGASAAQVSPSTFAAPVKLPGSAGGGEPSLIIDNTGRLYATHPRGIANVTGSGSPVWSSTNHGATWSQPVPPAEAPIAGGDTDLALDSHDDLFQTDLWLGNTAMSVSTDHGQTFTSNEWGHLTPVDDRPWLAYDKSSDTLYMTWDGADAVHVARTLPLGGNPQVGPGLPAGRPRGPRVRLRRLQPV